MTPQQTSQYTNPSDLFSFDTTPSIAASEDDLNNLKAIMESLVDCMQGKTRENIKKCADDLSRPDFPKNLLIVKQLSTQELESFLTDLRVPRNPSDKNSFIYTRRWINEVYGNNLTSDQKTEKEAILNNTRLVSLIDAVVNAHRYKVSSANSPMVGSRTYLSGVLGGVSSPLVRYSYTSPDMNRNILINTIVSNMNSLDIIITKLKNVDKKATETLMEKFNTFRELLNNVSNGTTPKPSTPPTPTCLVSKDDNEAIKVSLTQQANEKFEDDANNVLDGVDVIGDTKTNIISLLKYVKIINYLTNSNDGLNLILYFTDIIILLNQIKKDNDTTIFEKLIDKINNIDKDPSTGKKYLSQFFTTLSIVIELSLKEMEKNPDDSIKQFLVTVNNSTDVIKQVAEKTEANITGIEKVQTIVNDKNYFPDPTFYNTTTILKGTAAAAAAIAGLVYLYNNPDTISNVTNIVTTDPNLKTRATCILNDVSTYTYSLLKSLYKATSDAHGNAILANIPKTAAVLGKSTPIEKLTAFMNLVLNKSSQITQNKYMVGGATPVEMNVARGTQSRLIESLFNSILVKLAKQGKTISVHDENKFRILLQDMSTLEENLTKALQSLDRYTSTLARGIEDKSDGPVRIDNLESFVRENSKTVNRLIKRNIVAFTYLNTLNNSVPFLFIR